MCTACREYVLLRKGDRSQTCRCGNIVPWPQKRLMHCPRCQYYLYLQPAEKADMEMPFQSVHFCTNPDQIKAVLGEDHPNAGRPMALDTLETHWLNQAVKIQGVGKTKWNRTPAEGYLTGHRNDSAHEFTIFDPDDDTPIVIPAEMPGMNEMHWKIAEMIQDGGYLSIEDVPPEELAEIINRARELAVEERSYAPRKFNWEQWRTLQMWDHGCIFGSERGGQQDKTDLNLRIRAQIATQISIPSLNIKAK